VMLPAGPSACVCVTVVQVMIRRMMAARSPGAVPNRSSVRWQRVIDGMGVGWAAVMPCRSSIMIGRTTDDIWAVMPDPLGATSPGIANGNARIHASAVIRSAVCVACMSRMPASARGTDRPADVRSGHPSARTNVGAAGRASRRSGSDAGRTMSDRRRGERM
jgi:hypothetical protein